MKSLHLKNCKCRGLLILIVLCFLYVVNACIDSESSYPGDDDVDANAEDFDEFSYLVLNYK